MPAASAIAQPFLAELARPERGACAVLLYGSSLWSELHGSGSHPDFFVIVDSLRAWHRGLVPRLLNAILPPSIYRLRVGGQEAKVSITSVAQLKRYCSPRAPDLHHLGRLSKRVALVWARDDAARATVAEAQRAALQTLTPLALSGLGETVAIDDFMYRLLRLSYEAEVRIVEPGKVAALFDVEREHYRAIGRELLASFGALVDDDEAELPRGCGAPPAELESRLRRSRRRAILRWPKYILTFDGWLDYVMAKLARTGARPPLTERQRKHPLLFGMPFLLRLARAKRLR
jgi:hypothetical protein